MKTIFGIFQDTLKQMKQAQLLTVASSLAYTTILSIIPVLAVSFAIFQAFGGMQKLYEVIEPMILSYLAEGADEQAIEALHRFIGNIHAGAVGVGGLIGLIFTSMSMLFSAEKAINHVWQAPITRGLFQRISSYWLFITLGPLALSVLVGFATTSNLPISKFFPSGTGMFLITVSIFFCVYKWVPHVRVKWQYALISAAVTSTFFNLARLGYSLYTKNVVTYNAVYGSLGAVPILLLWIYIVWVIVLGGAALTAALQKRTQPISDSDAKLRQVVKE
jgi:membrane protein